MWVFWQCWQPFKGRYGRKIPSIFSLRRTAEISEISSIFACCPHLYKVWFFVGHWSHKKATETGGTKIYRRWTRNTAALHSIKVRKYTVTICKNTYKFRPGLEPILKPPHFELTLLNLKSNFWKYEKHSFFCYLKVSENNSQHSN